MVMIPERLDEVVGPGWGSCAQPDTGAVAGPQSAPLWPFTWAPEPFLPLDSPHPPHADPAAVGFRQRGCRPESRPYTHAAFLLGHRAPIDGVTNPSRSDAARRHAPRRAVRGPGGPASFAWDSQQSGALYRRQRHLIIGRYAPRPPRAAARRDIET